MNKQYKIGDKVLVRGIVNSEVSNGGIHVLHDGVDAFYTLDQINEPQKVVVPKFVAEWIEKCKDMNRSLRDAMKNTELSAELNAWFLKTGQDMFTYPNQETFARAWSDGYEVEQEKKYRVMLSNRQVLSKDDEFNTLFFVHDTTDLRSELTRLELEQAGFGWVFDCEGVKVEEVE